MSITMLSLLHNDFLKKYEIITKYFIVQYSKYCTVPVPQSKMRSFQKNRFVFLSIIVFFVIRETHHHTIVL